MFWAWDAGQWGPRSDTVSAVASCDGRGSHSAASEGMCVTCIEHGMVSTLKVSSSYGAALGIKQVALHCKRVVSTAFGNTELVAFASRSPHGPPARLLALCYRRGGTLAS